MQEIEVKILEIDRLAFEARLQEMGGQISFDDEMVARFYDWPDRAITQTGGVLRLRREGSQTMLTHKSAVSKSEAKVMEETETAVMDEAAMNQILQAMGLTIIKETRKFRRQYDLDQAHVVIDDYQGSLAHIPVFAEIEAPSVDMLHTLLQQLGYQPSDGLSWSTYDLVKHYGDYGE